MFSFTFRDLNSLNDFGIVVTKKPNIPVPQRNVEYIKVPGKSGSLIIDEETYDDILISVDCNFKDKNYMEKAEDIKAWLAGTQDKLIFSDDNEKYYIAQVVNTFDIIPMLKKFGQFTVVFNCQPFKMSVYNSTLRISSSRTFFNPGTYFSEPVFKIYGSGDVSITINGNVFSMSGLTDYVIVDSTLKDCYRENTLCNNKMAGDFPILKTDKNQISWTGNITRIEITPNWRWL